MKAIICTKYGSPEVLKLMEVDKPTPKTNELLIKIYATSVTASDCIIRGFKLPVSMWIPARLALGFTKPRKSILGLVLSGIIEDIGSEVTQFKIGEKIYAHTFMSFGAYAEYICLPEKSAVFSQVSMRRLPVMRLLSVWSVWVLVSAWCHVSYWTIVRWLPRSLCLMCTRS